MIPIVCDATLFARIDAHRQWHLLSYVHSRSMLALCRQGHFDHCSPSLFHFKEQCFEKCAPCRICNRCVESSLTARPVRQIASCCLIRSGSGAFDHAADRHSFNRDQPEAIHYASRLTLDKVFSPPSDPLMNSRHHLMLFGSRLVPFSTLESLREALARRFASIRKSADSQSAPRWRGTQRS